MSTRSATASLVPESSMRPLLVLGTIVLIGSASLSPGQDKADLPLLFADDFEKGADRWQPTDPKAWRVVKTDKGHVYNQFQTSKYAPKVRSPHNISLIKDLVVSDFALDAKVQSTGKDGPHRDMCPFFGHQYPSHFYYVHIAKKADGNANQVFIVNAETRKKIST